MSQHSYMYHFSIQQTAQREGWRTSQAKSSLACIRTLESTFAKARQLLVVRILLRQASHPAELDQSQILTPHQQQQPTKPLDLIIELRLLPSAQTHRSKRITCCQSTLAVTSAKIDEIRTTRPSSKGTTTGNKREPETNALFLMLSSLALHYGLASYRLSTSRCLRLTTT